LGGGAWNPKKIYEKSKGWGKGRHVLAWTSIKGGEVWPNRSGGGGSVGLTVFTSIPLRIDKRKRKSRTRRTKPLKRQENRGGREKKGIWDLIHPRGLGKKNALEEKM